MENAMLIDVLAQTRVREILEQAERDHLAARTPISRRGLAALILSRVRAVTARIAYRQRLGPPEVATV